MVNKRFKLILHILIWVLLLVIPYISTDQLFAQFVPAAGFQYLLLSVALSALLIFSFYFNYLVLIPKFLVAKKYGIYFFWLFSSVVVVFICAIPIFANSDFSPEVLSRKYPAIEKIMPIVIINTLSLWILSIVLSIVWNLDSRLKQTEQEKLTAQIATLKSQINPHFLFNTLNNIYATAIDTSPITADMVGRLSDMMRYTMKDTQQDFVLLEDEIDYLNNFIELQVLRMDRNIKLNIISLEHVPFLQIAPMLLIPFVENAFKHGVNSEQESNIKIEMTMNNSELQFKVVNNKVAVQHDIVERSGLGIENTKLRLNLIYPENHLLVIDDGDKEFSISLYINLRG